MMYPNAKMNQNGIHYTLHGDYYLPDLDLPERASAPIGHYGRMRKAYLEEQRPGLYERLLLSGRLYEHLSEIDTCCTERMDRMVSQMADAEGITESLKATDQMAWIGRMNNIRQRAEEIVLEEIVYA
ncbi:MAG: TnpV protein [Oscillospiraceae bacterium]|nr:TnpV protein [Oscillospiraceae bacterium]